MDAAETAVASLDTNGYRAHVPPAEDYCEHACAGSSLVSVAPLSVGLSHLQDALSDMSLQLPTWLWLVAPLEA